MLVHWQYGIKIHLALLSDSPYTVEWERGRHVVPYLRHLLRDNIHLASVVQLKKISLSGHLKCIVSPSLTLDSIFFSLLGRI